MSSCIGGGFRPSRPHAQEVVCVHDVPMHAAMRGGFVHDVSCIGGGFCPACPRTRWRVLSITSLCIGGGFCSACPHA